MSPKSNWACCPGNASTAASAAPPNWHTNCPPGKLNATKTPAASAGASPPQMLGFDSDTCTHNFEMDEPLAWDENRNPSIKTRGVRFFYANLDKRLARNLGDIRGIDRGCETITTFRFDQTCLPI